MTSVMVYCSCRLCKYPETGIMTEETLDAYGANAAYTADNYGASANLR